MSASSEGKKKGKKGEKNGSSNSSCEKEEKKCEKKKLEPFPNKIMIKSCKPKPKPHPCDPPKPCNPSDEVEGECPKPVLCLNKLKNPEDPIDSRCKEGKFIGVESCKTKASKTLHPCDPKPDCKPGVPKKEPCPEVALCIEKIKNPVPKRIICPSPHDAFSDPLCENAGLWQQPPICNPEDVKKPEVKINHCENEAKKEKDPKDVGCPEKSPY